MYAFAQWGRDVLTHYCSFCCVSRRVVTVALITVRLIVSNTGQLNSKNAAMEFQKQVVFSTVDQFIDVVKKARSTVHLDN